MGFTHLHLHTEYSLLDGAASIKRVVARAKELGMTSLAITDHGVMFGVVDFYRECKANGINPVIGCEIYLAKRTRFDKDITKDKHQGHLVLLAKNQQGYKNLMKIVSKAYTEGFYYKPRADKDLLRENCEGIIALSACLAGEIQFKLGMGDYEGAKKEALEMEEIFGKGNFYLEIQDQGLEKEAEIFPLMMKIHEETGIPIVATNDVHYVNQADAEDHDVLLCIQMGTRIDDENRMRFANDQFYLKSDKEMRTIFSHIPEACDNTEIIANQCKVDFTFGEYHLPEFVSPEGFNNRQYLRSLCEEGLRERYPKDYKEYEERLNEELFIIESMGYVEYFLIVWDFIYYAKTHGIMVGPGRGSAAGSIVAYTLKITDIDPMKYNLIFERFLNPERVSMPDIDIDFCYERRGEVIDYVVEKYGEEKVAQIITFGTLKAKAAVRDVGRALNISYGEVDAIAKAIPMELKMTIDKALVANPQLKESYNNDPKVKQVLDKARAIEGMPRHASTHAAGVVISKEAMDEYVPLFLAEKGVSTQFPMTTVEELGLLKMDFLGLRNLTVIRDALELIQKNHNIDINFETMDYDDPKVYEMISKGNTQGIFQLESSGMTQFMKNLKPDCFEDIVAGISLYRPGPMASIPTYIANKKHPDKIKYIHPLLKPILSVTYGCMVYQEQVMQIVRDLAGYTYGQSDILRRAMGKKKMDVMLAEKSVFIQGAKERGVEEKDGEEIFNQMASFAEYAFNKSHAAAYAVIGYETGYLKAHYPVEFMAALLTSVMGDGTATYKYIRNCQEMGIEVLPPDINESDKKYTVINGNIRYGLLGVKNVGEHAIEAIIESREKNGSPKDIHTFISNIDVQRVNKKAIESLIKAGALDSLNENRRAHIQVYENLLESVQKDTRKNIAGQISLFQTNTEEMENDNVAIELPKVDNYSKQELGKMEKEMLGVYIKDHPLGEFAKIIEERISVTLGDLGAENQETFHDGQEVIVAGIISGKKNLLTRKNQQMAFLDLEDLTGDGEVIVFPNVFEKYSSLLEEDNIVAIKGTLNFKEEEKPKILANTIMDIRRIEKPESQIKIRVNKEGEEEILEEIKKIISHHLGDIPIILFLSDGRKMKTGRNLWTNGSEEFFKEMKSLVGEENIKES